MWTVQIQQLEKSRASGEKGGKVMYQSDQSGLIITYIITVFFHSDIAA
jgi:hypothetical protein